MAEKTLRKVYKKRRSGDTVHYGFRCDTEVWAQFMLVAKRQELSSNAALSRLVRHAVANDWIPEYIKEPRLPFGTPAKDEETKTYSLPDPAERAESPKTV